MYETVETRWFGQGQAPEDIVTWFETSGKPADEQSVREDRYLRSMEGDGLSVKVRQGGLEVKQRQRNYGEVRFNVSVIGLVESWIKWRFPLQAAESPILQDRNWLAVEKARQLRRYQIDGHHVVQTSAELSVGCEVELSTLRAGGKTWWSVAFEAFGRDAGNYDRLLAVAGLLLAEAPLPSLLAADSYAYPHWLALLD